MLQISKAYEVCEMKMKKEKNSQVESKHSLFLQRKMWVPHIKNKDSVHM